ncbi:hypothetical protein M0R45_036691 [Rubus argutus]|uniref:Cucumisin n=1 Tax=Rubus argutus TaxID=59490 RepID=A0AAW1VXX5_RUBAR
MSNHRAIILFYVFLILILNKFLLCNAIDEDRKVHIVYLGSLPDNEAYSQLYHHLGILERVVRSNSAVKFLTRSYKRSFNGFAANLTDQERERLASMKEVVSVFPSRTFQLQTTRSWDFIGLDEKIHRNATVESNVIIGVIDSGIWPESESFKDEGLGPAPKKWKGACAGGKNFTCNNKIIGARFYKPADSARDEHGHGTHTASTAAGNAVRDVSYYGIAQGTARGGVPSARIVAYRACVRSCSSEAILAAFDDAIADGVDIITISIGPDKLSPFNEDALAIGAFHAMEKGILTAILQATMVHLAFETHEAYHAGALGSIFNTSILDIAYGYALPAAGLSYQDYNVVKSYMNSSKDPRANILKSEDIKDPCAPVVASFSSRGPNQILPEIIKPDITAPGVDILAAYLPAAAITGTAKYQSPIKYSILSGTSMSCPHAAGAAAYVKAFHPDWSPAAIKSSLMTTAWSMNDTENSPGEFAFGSGHINPLKAINPGLVYEATKEDYIKLLCLLFDEIKVRLISGDKSTCAIGSDSGSPKDHNYPSMVAIVGPMTPFTVKIHRRVINVGLANSTYQAKILSNSQVDIKVMPQVLAFKSLNEEKTFDVSIIGSGIPDGSHVSASLLWYDGTHSVRSPILVRSIAA